MKKIFVKISKLEQNKGQIEGLPCNPRLWGKEDLEKLWESLEETPELLSARPLIIIPFREKYVVIGGNMRFEALKKHKIKEVECILLEDYGISKLKEIVLKDNVNFGSWNYDALESEWSSERLEDMGIDLLPDLDDINVNEGGEVDVSEYKEEMTIVFKFDEEDGLRVKERFAGIDPKEEILRMLEYEVE